MATHQLIALMSDRIAASLKRGSLDRCSKWAEAYRVMGSPFPGPWSFKYHPWLREMHDSQSQVNVGQKAAQMGFTETALNITFYNIDVKGLDCLYVLPAKTPDATDFSASRFDPALELAPHLKSMFSEVKNVGHKRAGTTNLFVRGSRSRSSLKSIPVGLIIFDEVDEMEQDNIGLARERSSGQTEKKEWNISTPTLPKVGINKLYIHSTEEHFFFPCPACSRYTQLVFPDCLEITTDNPHDPSIANTRLLCKECKATLDHRTKYIWLAEGKWVPKRTDKDVRGFHVNQLYSSTVSPAEFGKAYLLSTTNPTDEQEFHNSKMGETHIVAEAQVTDADIEDCIGNYRNGELNPRGIITMGVDVGKFLHYEIDDFLPGRSYDINADSLCRVIKFGKLDHFEEIDDLIMQYRIRFCVVDMQPERRKAIELANRFWGHVKTCYYAMGIHGKEISEIKHEPTIQVDRTSWLDLSMSRFKHKRIVLPKDISYEYREHVKSLVRDYYKDQHGNPCSRWTNVDDDHYAHARNYAEIALPLAASIGGSSNIREKVL